MPRWVHIPRTGLLAALLLALWLPSARGQSLIRDAEIEYALHELARPVISAAGLNPATLRVMILNDSSMNAFVADHRTVFLHSGLLLRLETPAQVQAVIAHELAHIANGHITRRMANLRGARSIGAIGLVLAAAAASVDARAGVGVAIGTASTAQRLFFAHTRAEEAAADQSGVRFMADAGVDPNAMIEVLELFRGQEALSVSRRDPYALTHPLSSERLRALKGYAAGYSGGSESASSRYWHARARGKLEAFLRNPSYTLRKIGRSDTSDVALMRRAIAYHRQPDTAKAMKAIDQLAANRPKDPFVHELRGQILLESRQFSAAVNAYERAVSLAPKHPLILSGYGRALLALNTAGADRKALAVLERAHARDPYDPRMLRDLAQVHARLGQNGLASVATAERYALGGRLTDAAVHAKRAEGLLARGSPGWLRAQDILGAAAQAKR
ncbi:putative Zn-dependent protease [Rhodovulum imhoffii]|uniref:Putative Zn-dependent protease n=1 Tax=Rhodovulum imhoffii TaxID=365340 RepID=A0A2T5BVR7_9RHOB|nr:M48 family metalloprotease [Rhodovulum imhoffii]MBK5933221.1 peptidase M48 [Rhodovulum imhoffii]PTN03678.1 putative Zn-dependent protease [Rhodovulum imhoffii]